MYVCTYECVHVSVRVCIARYITMQHNTLSRCLSLRRMQDPF